MLWKPYTRSGSFLYQRDVKIVHDFDAIFLIYKPIIDVLMKKSSLIDLNVFRKVLIGLGISSSHSIRIMRLQTLTSQVRMK